MTDIEYAKFEKKLIEIRNKDGEIIFREEIEFPEGFDDSHAAIVASRYLCNNAKRKEKSLVDMIDRVTDEIVNWAEKDGYFDSKEDLSDFKYKLKYYQLNGYFAFNSPVYFNVGLTAKPQTSACFILDIQDNMESIFNLAKLESIIFKHGSGSGVNMSTLRSSKETVSRGGFASGPISFLKAHDIVAGVIKSGGTLRRSAKLVCLDDSHPDIEDFICCKDKEEEKLRAIANAGIKPTSGYDLTDEVFYQNTNISVRLSNRFMKAAERNEEWSLVYVNSDGIYKTTKARDLLLQIAEHAWKTGDPGVQFSDTMNTWNTVLNDGEIKASNPCGEFVFINNSSCNLASINLLKFFPDKDNFRFDTFIDVIRTMIIAQDILINNSSYPSKEIEENSRNYRPLGAGYTNLGALLMFLGLPYDSDEGRNIASLLSALETGVAYLTSNDLAEKLGSFEYFERNKTSLYRVMNKHIDSVNKLIDNNNGIFENLKQEVMNVWNKLKDLVNDQKAFRNATVTLLAPTGTISSLMQAATTGLEPEFSLVRYKTLSGSDGAVLKFVNPIIEESLKNLEYSKNDIHEIIEYIKENGHLENCKNLKKEHLPIFDTAIVPKGCSRIIDYMGHVKMCAAIQPFISMAMSKTINMPNSATVQDVYKLYIKAWKMGLKGITIYRDGSKSFQPLSAETKKEEPKVEFYSGIHRRKLPDDRPAHRHKFRVGNVEGYLAPGLYPDTGELGEIFIDLTKEGSTLSGFADALATIVSISLQYGVPLKDFVKKMMFLRFEPAGFTSNPDIRSCTSIVDYIFKYLGMHYLSVEDRQELGLMPKQITDNGLEKITREITKKIAIENDAAPTCPECGSVMRLLGSCWTCISCAWNEGSCG